MRFTRRDIGKLALSALPAASLLARALSVCAQSRPNSTINGVRVGAITYSYRTMPDQSAEAILRYVVDSGISQVEFMGGPIEAFAGAPQAPQGAGGPPRRPGSHTRAAGGAARGVRQAQGVAHVGFNGSLQGATEDVQRRRCDDLRMEADEPEHV